MARGRLLSVGQIYLLDNPLLKEPLAAEHVKPRLLGHWGTTPGLNFVYAHLNRAIRRHDLDMIFICGPGHGGPAMVANTYLEGTYSELYHAVTRDIVKDPKTWRILGTRVRVVDAEEIVTGRARYGIDTQMPGALVAVMARCPTFDGQLESFDASAAKKIRRSARRRRDSGPEAR